MLRTIGILALLTAAASRAYAGTTIADTIRSPFNSDVFVGTMTISCARAQTSTGGAIAQSTLVVSVTNGTFSVTIQPYVTSSPSSPCSVTYNTTDTLGNPISWFERWVVPASSRTLTISDVLVRSGNPIPLCPTCVVTTGAYPDPPWITYLSFSKLSTGTLDASAATATSPFKIGTALPASCVVGQSFFKTNAAAGSNIYACTSTNTWTVQAGGGGGATTFDQIGSGTNTSAAMVVSSGATLNYAGTGVINANQIAGTPVAGISGMVKMVSGAPSAGSAGSDYSAPATSETTVGNRTFTGAIDASGATHSIPAKVGLAASKPGTCTTGEMYFATDATAGQNWYYCTASNTWTQQLNSGGGGGSITTIAAGTGVSVSGGTGPTATVSADTAVMLTRANAQAGTTLFVTETSSSATTYTGTMNPTLTGYTTGQAITWKFVTSCTAGAVTVNIDTLGAKSLKLYDGSTNPSALDCASGTVRTIKYDGTVFRLDGGPSTTTSVTAQVPLPVGGCNNGGAGGTPAWNIGTAGYECGAASHDIAFVPAGSVYAFRYFRWPADWAFGTAAVVRITVSQGGGVASGNFKLDAALSCTTSYNGSTATYNTAATTGSFAAPTINVISEQVTGTIDTTSCAQNGFAILKLTRDSSVGSNSSLTAQVLDVAITH